MKTTGNILEDCWEAQIHVKWLISQKLTWNYKYFKKSILYGAKYSEGIKKDNLYCGLYRMIFSGSREASTPNKSELILRQFSNAEKLH